MRIKHCLIICMALFAFQNVSAQETMPPPSIQPLNNQSAPSEFESFRERIYIGGNVGAMFGSTTYINVSPIVGFQVTKKFSAGIGGTYNYLRENYAGQKYISTVYGSNVVGRYLFTDNFFAQAQWDRLSVLDYTSPILNQRAWIDNLLIGGGYRQLFTAKASFVAMIFYNINQVPLSPYNNPVIQIGFNIGL